MAQDDGRAAEGRWTRLFAPHLDAAFRLARWLTGSRAEAEEVVQEACLRAWRATGPEPASPRAWLLAITRNAAWTRLSRTGAGNVVSLEEAARELDRAAAALPGAEALVAARERSAVLRQALAALPAPLREVVVLRDIEDLSYREIAAVLDLPIGTVMSRLARGRRRLRDILAKEAANARDAG
ncbi:sigma-70 family RNA polymerase sigma factor [Plastoroseomonas hellenica]|uniref:sigma-70 family RNA polymerase sigma factor n=1 Tax=Plastoroseomonas hellenica TaxID=2687306 RepID=UPI001BAC5AC6|nr:sigma-70 family RNA polymerase sigma factor [Plastoroseomonas hellenica]MBR0644789.1 sigma-70 family RNA polymerase sigma factor [Plastoroseomonas hellenica]